MYSTKNNQKEKQVKTDLKNVLCAVLFAASVCIADAQVRVVATSPVMSDIVRGVAGDKVAVKGLVPPGGDPHVYEPKPRDMKTLKDADLFFEVGLGYETWADKMFKASGSHAVRVVTSEGVKPIRAEACEEHGHKGHDHCDHGEFDPHVWTDPACVMQMTKNVIDALVKADPANRDTYKKNGEAYLASLKKLDKWISSEVSTLPKVQRKLVTNHDWLGYFAKRYEFELVDNLLGGISTDTTEPSAKRITSIAKKIRASKVKAIFAEAGHQNKTLGLVAKAAGVQVAPELFHEVSTPGSGAATYDEMMRHNVKAILEALK